MAWGLVGFGAKTASNAGDQLAQLYGYLNQCLNFILGNSSRFGTKHSQLLLLVKLIRRLSYSVMFWRNLYKFNANNEHKTQTYSSP